MLSQPQRLLRFASDHVRHGLALARRRPLLFLGVFLCKWLVVWLLLNMHHGDRSTASTKVRGGGDREAAADERIVRNGIEGRSQRSEFHRRLPQNEDDRHRGAEGSPKAPIGATIVTALGDIVLDFLPDDAPKTVANFVELARRGFFNRSHLYRYEKNFVLQGGGWPTKSSPLPPVPLEYKVPNFKFMVSTARTADPNSATSEYSIMLNDNSRWLGPGGSDPHGYAVFAKVVGGFDVIERFASLKTKQSGLTLLDPPVEVRAWTLRNEPLTSPQSL